VSADASDSRQPDAPGEHRLTAARQAKVKELRQQGIEPYPLRWVNSHTLSEAVAHFEQSERQGRERGDEVAVAGRVVARRDLGKVAFIDISGAGDRLQAQVSAELKQPFELLKYIDLGDFIGVKGRLFRTKRGAVTVEASSLTLLSKALNPPPDKWSGLKNLEIRRRRRYVDMLARADAVKAALKRSQIVAATRAHMSKNGYTEVETPILNPIAAGAFASRFKTKHAWTDHDLFLRVATELPLKKLLVGGLERVYEIGKVFRNEHVDKSHSAEFTTLEAYQAFGSYRDMMNLVENLFAEVALAVNGATILPPAEKDGEPTDIAPPWRRINLLERIEQISGIDLTKVRERDELIAAIDKFKRSGKMQRPIAFNIADDMSWARIVDHLISVLVEPLLREPCFLVDYPVETTPLAKRSERDPDIVERAEGFVYGIEVANMFSELNDPIDQRRRMEEMEALNLEYMRRKSVKQRAEDSEQDRLDPDFLTAVEYGMPPAGGVGVGVDRMVMLLTGESNIGDVILFPSLYDAS